MATQLLPNVKSGCIFALSNENCFFISTLDIFRTFKLPNFQLLIFYQIIVPNLVGYGSAICVFDKLVYLKKLTEK